MKVSDQFLIKMLPEIPSDHKPMIKNQPSSMFMATLRQRAQTNAELMKVCQNEGFLPTYTDPYLAQFQPHFPEENSPRHLKDSDDPSLLKWENYSWNSVAPPLPSLESRANGL